jgi:acyl carrier protein
MNIDNEKVRAFIGKLQVVPNPGRLLNDVPLEQQGMDSLDLVNLLFRLQEEYQVELPESEVDGIQSINDIVSVMGRKLNQQ